MIDLFWEYLLYFRWRELANAESTEEAQSEQSEVNKVVCYIAVVLLVPLFEGV